MFLWMTLQIYKMEFESQTGEIKSIWSIYLFIYLFLKVDTIIKAFGEMLHVECYLGNGS